MRWFESPKGYTTQFGRERATVFYSSRDKNWSFVVGRGFVNGFKTVHDAMDAVEKANGFHADRTGVQNVPPAERQAQRQSREHFRHQFESFNDQEDAAKYVWEQFQQQRRQQQRQNQQQQWQNQQQRRQQRGMPSYEDFMRQAGARSVPWWATILKLTGQGPWKLAEARASFAILAKTHHPDMGGTNEMIQKINEAWRAAKLECKA